MSNKPILLKFSSSNATLLAGIPVKEITSLPHTQQNNTGKHTSQKNASVATLVTTLESEGMRLVDLHRFTRDGTKYFIVATYATTGNKIDDSPIQEFISSVYGDIHVWDNPPPTNTITVNCNMRTPANQWKGSITELVLPN